MKNRSIIITLIILLSIISIALILLMIGLINNRFRFPFFNFNYDLMDDLVLDEIYDTHFEQIKIEADASMIDIQTSLDDKVRVVVYGKKENTRVEATNSELKIKSKEKKCVGFCFNFKVSKVEVYLPENYDQKITITNKFGDIEIAELLSADIQIEEDCGDVNVKGANTVKISNSYGDIHLEKANIATIDAKAGDVKIGIINEVTVNNAYGDIKITEVNRYLNLKDNCGDIKIERINLNKNSFITNDLGDIKIGSTNEIYIDAKTDLGDVNINHNYHKSDITLKIENDCGDIKVSN